MVANIPTLSIYVDCQKAYDKVWHAALIVKQNRVGMPHGLLKVITSWLTDRQVYLVFGKQKPNKFKIFSSLPQSSSLSPFSLSSFTVIYLHLLERTCLFFADDFNVLIRPPISKKFCIRDRISRKRRNQNMQSELSVLTEMEATGKC